MNLNKLIFGLIKCLQWCCLDSCLQRTLAFLASSALDHSDLFLWLETGFQKTVFQSVCICVLDLFFDEQYYHV